MVNYAELSDEQNVLLYQLYNDQDAVNVLVARHDPFLRRKAELAASKHKAIDYETFYSYFVDRFLSAIRRFDCKRSMPFNKWLATKLYRADIALVRDKLYVHVEEGGKRSKSGRLKTLKTISFDAVTKSDDGDSDESDRRLSTMIARKDEYPFEVDELFRVLTDEERRAVHAALTGATLVDIAKSLGRSGTDETLRKYGWRVMESIRAKVREFYVSIGTPLTAY